MAAAPCTCHSYAFPHRVGGGKCIDDGTGCFCGDCGQPADPVERDFGIGAYECWGRTGVHRDARIVSRCCEADLFADASLKTDYL